VGKQGEFDVIYFSVVDFIKQNNQNLFKKEEKI
jgi:hypothetical protein